MNTKFYFPILALALSVAACNDKKAATQTGGIDVANLDRSVTPNQDFYQFACGGWMHEHPLTDEYGRSALSICWLRITGSRCKG